jgi:quercetin dioxygenase-like cupin family protein
MAHSRATGEALVSNGDLGIDVIRLGAGDGFAAHTHPGHHLLIVVGGRGTITFDGHIYPTVAGQVYFVPGRIAHAVGAVTDHVILAVGAPHRPVDSPERMALTEYSAVTSELGSLACAICEITANFPSRLHELGCVHCPCPMCVDVSP